MENKQSSFFDKNTIIAVSLTILVWIGWSRYMQEKYPNIQQDKVVNTDNKTETSSAASATLDGANNTNSKLTTASAKLEEKKEIKRAQLSPKFSFEFDNFSFDVVPEGMGLANIKLKKFTDRDNKLIVLSDSSESYPLFATQLKGKTEPVYFQLKKVSETEIVGSYKLNGLVVEKKYEINPESYSIESSVLIKSEESLAGVQTILSEKAKGPAEISIMNPSTEKQEFVVRHKEGTDRNIFDTEEPFIGEYKSTYMASITSHYFASAVVDSSEVTPNFSSNYDKTKTSALGYLNYPIFAGTKELKLSYKLFLGPKDLNILKAVDLNLSEIVDYGWFSFFAEPLLGVMKWLYALIGNWGLAIIGLTLLVRLVVMPFNVFSYKSMAKMQKIQPALKAVREKHKDDQVLMNQEVMALMKENKVNPAGGCLPMLVQFPIFIALYRVLSESVDLYKAPFGLWIADLSLKDPYYVLPVLMGVSMFIQQKITPNTMDPAQQKVMMIMPVMFSLLMISLPSGLTLYIFVSTLFGIIQQQLFMKKA